MEISDFIPAQVAGTIDGLFRERVRQTPDMAAYSHFDRKEKQWLNYSWHDMAERVSRWQQSLQQSGLEKKDRIAICMKNGPEWVICDLASLSNGQVVVPLYIEDRPDNIAYVIQDSGAKLLAIQDCKHWQHLINTAPDALKGVRHVIVIEGDAEVEVELRDAEGNGPRMWTYDEWMAHDPLPLKERGGDPDELATIVYTSGTTGKPKGVMLSHRNILSVAQGAGEAVGVRRGQTCLSFLPLSHTFERTCGYYTPMMWAMPISYARSVQTLADDLLAIRPHVLISVPRIFERVYERIQGQLEKESIVKRRLFQFAVRTGWHHFLHRQRLRRHPISPLIWPFFRKRIAVRLLDKLGGRIEIAISGGAALPEPVAQLFLGMGLNLIQGYGMTESAPVVSANRPYANDPRSVGQPLDGIQVRVAENDELQIHSPGIMLGYWNNHKATREVMTEDGWLRTGDKARLHNNMIYITGRIKDILVMSNGEKIPPVDMEDAIKLNPLFENAVIVGEGKPYLSAIVVLESENWVKLARQHKLDPFDHTALADNRLHRSLLNHISTALKGFPGYAKIRKIWPVLDQWTVENGLLTPTLKTRRQLIVEKFAREIDRLYAG